VEGRRFVDFFVTTALSGISTVFARQTSMISPVADDCGLL
jgi:hypothetical protein